jgi:hypothetical protein
LRSLVRGGGTNPVGWVGSIFFYTNDWVTSFYGFYLPYSLFPYFFFVFGLAVAAVGLGLAPAVGAGIGTDVSSFYCWLRIFLGIYSPYFTSFFSLWLLIYFWENRFLRIFWVNNRKSLHQYQCLHLLQVLALNQQLLQLSQKQRKSKEIRNKVSKNHKRK